MRWSGLALERIHSAYLVYFVVTSAWAVSAAPDRCAICPLLLPSGQVLVHQHDRRRCPSDFAVTQESHDLPMIPAALHRRNRGPLQNLLPVRKGNRLIFTTRKRLGGVHSPVSLSPEPKVNGSVYQDFGMAPAQFPVQQVTSDSIRGRPGRRPSHRQGVKPALSSGE